MEFLVYIIAIIWCIIICLKFTDCYLKNNQKLKQYYPLLDFIINITLFSVFIILTLILIYIIIKLISFCLLPGACGWERRSRDNLIKYLYKVLTGRPSTQPGSSFGGGPSQGPSPGGQGGGADPGPGPGNGPGPMHEQPRRRRTRIIFTRDYDIENLITEKLRDRGEISSAYNPNTINIGG